ncbi:WD40-repeat-containing domain protein [Tricharina praecox]|uniref:WD40-repeat-containing domain protein n=1 Tax=Tricharina praecox TaxID=43433 RepID=UPI00221F8F6A|nr:WD40-repeat-containing domain protein [Tricharina praecox]XP_051337429.1 WD40-repeat-containing domain protein [Tricharina praecox]KAI5843207.1 WD40-repeat-containing domain protein [Tricharina praecox]KAI5847620.1 WD40-repeat-containing domain protein [Tricharina praecox]
MSRKGSIGSRPNSTISVASVIRDDIPELLPCYASSQFVLQAQGSSILCLQHDSLAAERRFVRHKENVTIIAVDNISDVVATRVVSVDKSKTAIVWDIDSGEVLSQYEAYEDILVASWMKNGNLVFGDSLGNLILFNPENADAITARTIFDPLCAIAPTADCKAFALGYNNGSVLIAALSPAFTILHTLTTTSMQPSTITTLAWHASSSKQKSDMLAVQTRDGDLRVWSVPKSLDGDESARVVRILKRPEASGRGNNWLGWSRNGRIVQYSAGATTVWDVRTKNVTWEEVPTPNNVVGICIYGPHGSLFTLSKDHTVQQYMLYPPQLVANIHHDPPMLPPSPPVDLIGENDETAVIVVQNQQQDDYSMTVASSMGHTLHEPEHLEPMEYREEGLGIANIVGQRPSSTSSRGSRGSAELRRNYGSSGRKGSTASMEPREQYSSPPTTDRKASAGSIEQREQYSGSPVVGRRPSITSRKTHPLRHEIHISPETTQVPVKALPGSLAHVTDIFANLRIRLNTVTYESPRDGGRQNKLSEDDHRKEMLFCVFGWKGDIEELIGDELESVNARSLNSLVLRMWLGDLDQNSLAVMLGADFSVSGDWLFLALSAMGGQNSWTHVARAFVLKLLQKGEIHTAVLCLLAIGDKNDAVEIYISHKLYL